MPELEEHRMIREMGGLIHFRAIGFDTHMWRDGKMQETIFFITNFPSEGTRLESVTPEAVDEFVAYWENQIAAAKAYKANGCNPNTHEWTKEV
jgi:hypothetical protein